MDAETALPIAPPSPDAPTAKAIWPAVHSDGFASQFKPGARDAQSGTKPER